MNKNMATPFFLIDEKILSSNICGFKDALDSIWPNSILAYSVKTNSLPWVLKYMNSHGIYAEVVSDEEYELALLSGYTPESIIFNGPIKGDEYILSAVENGSVINIDSNKEIKFLSRLNNSLSGRIGVRVNVNPEIFDSNDIGYSEDGFRFGFCYENGELFKAIKSIEQINGGARIGLHMHVNSVTRSLNVYKAVARYGASIIRNSKLHVSYIDIGGGFFGGVPNKPTPKEYISVIKEEFENCVDIGETQLIIEPGSALIGSAVDLYTSVVDVKDTVLARIITTDGSRIYIDPLWKKGDYNYSCETKGQPFSRQVVCGYTCMDHDRIMVMKDKPELSVGDKIIYHRVGNYTITMGGPFIRPFPDVYVKTDEVIQKVRAKMDMKEYYRMETL